MVTNKTAIVLRTTEIVSHSDIAICTLAYVYEVNDALRLYKDFHPTVLGDLLEQHTGDRDLTSVIDIVHCAIEALPMDQTDEFLYDVADCYFNRGQTIGHISVLLGIPVGRVITCLKYIKERMVDAFKHADRWQKA